MRKALVPLLLSVFISFSAGAEELKMQDNPPERYVVVKGDTLWAISGRFLKNPWQWPEIWRMNKDEIKDPHWIYPGDVVVLDKSGASPRLRLVKQEKVGANVAKLSPQARVESMHSTAIPSIAPSAIEPFLSKPLVTEKGALDSAPRIGAPEENRVVLGAGNRAYVHNLKEDGGTFWYIYRSGNALVDPDNNEILGYEAVYLGDARVAKFGDVSTVDIVKSNQEILTGDRLLVPPKETFTSYVPHAPVTPISGRIISVYGGVAEAGQSAIVAISRGTRDGVENGHVLALYRHGEKLRSRHGEETDIQLPDERYGLVFVFRTFERVSYALVMQSSRPVNALDVVQNP
jgi:hypothetical protein